MKSLYSLVCGGFLAAVVGCGTSTTTNSTIPPPVDAPANRTVMKPPVTDPVLVPERKVDVEVGPPGARPGVEVETNPGGGTNVQIDGERIRERIQERREDRLESKPVTPIAPNVEVTP